MDALVKLSDDYFRQRGVFREWLFDPAKELPRLVSVKERWGDYPRQVIKLRHVAGWACGCLLTLAAEQGATSYLQRYQYRKVTGTEISNARRANAMLSRRGDILRVCIGDEIYYLVMRYDTRREDWDMYRDKYASEDFRVLAWCQAEDIRNALWTRNISKYKFDIEELKRRVIDLRVYPILGSIPNFKVLTTGKAYKTSVASIELVHRDIAILFPLYPTGLGSVEYYTELGTALEKAVLNHATQGEGIEVSQQETRVSREIFSNRRNFRSSVERYAD